MGTIGTVKLTIRISMSSTAGRKIKEALEEVWEIRKEHPDIDINIEVTR